MNSNKSFLPLVAAAARNPLAFMLLPLVFLFTFQGQGKDKDLNSKSASDLSEDLFKVHDFDVKIDLQVPSSGM